MSLKERGNVEIDDKDFYDLHKSIFFILVFQAGLIIAIVILLSVMLNAKIS